MASSKVHILAPARDISVARAAIQAGADAVYIGAPKFGARQAAGNSMEDLAALVAYARPYGVQVLVTLNTLMDADERREAAAMAHELYHMGVYALIIQDLRLLEENLPPIRLHASTQCDNRTADYVRHLRELGFRRVVLARELSLEEIRAIHLAVPDMELEVFVHGALCVSYSGRCYMSECLLSRSANRGCCAQMCRMRYDLLDENMQYVLDAAGRPIHQRYVLSLQDMDRSLYLRELIDAGVTAFKIEGRLKDKAYVTNVVAYYRQRLSEVMPNADCDSYQYDFVPNPEKTFHRGGIDYFLHGRTHRMANWDTPKSTGEPIRDITVLHPGDGISVGDQGFQVNAIRGGHIVTNRPVRIPTGATLYRNLDVQFLRSLRATRRIPVDIVLEETPKGFALTIGTATCHFSCDKMSADNPERAWRTVREQLSKLGDTIYTVRSLNIKTAIATEGHFPYFIPISQLNQWRRQVIKKL